MANEITVNARLRVSKGNKSLTRSVSNLQFDWSGDKWTYQVQQIGTSKEQLDIGGDLTDAGYAWFRNQDGTNFVEVGIDAATDGFTPFIKLEPGEVALCPLSQTTMHAKADTAAVDLEYWVLER